MRFGQAAGIAVTLVALAAGTAHADTSVIARAGAWQAFGGTSQDGTQVCGVSTSWPDDRYFGVKYYKGDNTFTIQLGSPEWKVEDGAKQPIVMTVDRRSPWRGNATGMHFSDSAGLQFEISRNQLAQFIEEFRSGESLYLSFPGTTAADWTATLSGSDAVMNSFAACNDAM